MARPLLSRTTEARRAALEDRLSTGCGGFIFRQLRTGPCLEDLDELRFRAGRGPAERRHYFDALERRYGAELKAGNARGRRLLAELYKTYGGQPRTELAKEFFERLLPLLPKGDQEMFLKEMLQDAQATAYDRLEASWSWWRRLWNRF